MIDKTLLEKLLARANELLPAQLTDEVRKNIKAALRGIFEQMELVTREELEVQEAVLARTREKLSRIEKELAELRQAVKDRK